MALYPVRELPPKVRAIVVGLMDAQDTDFLVHNEETDHVTLTRPAIKPVAESLIRWITECGVEALVSPAESPQRPARVAGDPRPLLLLP